MVLDDYCESFFFYPGGSGHFYEYPWALLLGGFSCIIRVSLEL